MNETVAFRRFVAAKTQEAATADIERLSTTFDGRQDAGLQGIGNAWSRLHYGSNFGLVRAHRRRTAVSLVFVQTKNGNTKPPELMAFTSKQWDENGSLVIFEHCLITSQRELSSAIRPADVSGPP